MLSGRLRETLAGPYVQGFVGAVVLMAYALVNGYALFFNDTRSYVRGPALAIKALTHVELAPEWRARSSMPKVLIELPPPAQSAPTSRVDPPATPGGQERETGTAFTANRSVYYGILALAGYLSSDFWLTIFVQCLVVSLPMALIAVRGFGMPPLRWLLTVAVVGLATTLGPIAALIMPDIFAPALLLATAALFVFWDRLRRIDIIVLFAIAAMAVLAHPSHIAILSALIAILAAYWLLRRPLWGGGKVVVLLAAVAVLGVAGQVAFSKALEIATGQKPLVLPHITAHLQATGPGYAYLKASCPEVGLAVCNYMDRLPMFWADFLGADAKRGVFVVADAATKRRLSEEQKAYALGVLRTDPLGLAASLAKDAASQLGRFSLSDVEVTAAARANYRTSFPANVADRIEASRAGRSPALLRALSISTGVLTAAAAVLLALMVLRPKLLRLNSETASRYWTLASVLLGGVILNACICGILASPYDRFQSRVIWLAPLVAMIGLMIGRRVDQVAK